MTGDVHEILRDFDAEDATASESAMECLYFLNRLDPDAPRTAEVAAQTFALLAIADAISSGARSRGPREILADAARRKENDQ